MRKISRNLSNLTDRASQSLTKHAQLRSMCGVSFLRRIIAIALLALWMPMTQHCGLEAAGLVAAEVPHAASAPCCVSGDRCSHDGCEIVESGLSKPSVEKISVSAPDFSVCLNFLCLQLLSLDSPVDSVTSVSASGRPLDWTPVWQFVRRAAPLARAPSQLG